MYLAELRGKLSGDIENKEDVLTSNVFSFLKYAPRQIFLSRFLDIFNIHVSKKELIDAKFEFWPSYDDGTEPDVVISVGDYYILIEAKYRSGFGQKNGFISHQLDREYYEGKQTANQLNKQFLMATITADSFNKPKLFEDIKQTVKEEIFWLNWQKIPDCMNIM